MVDQHRVLVVVEVVDVQELFDLGDARLGDRDLELRLLDLVVLVPRELRSDPRERLVPLRAVLHHAADDQRGPRLIDQDRVDLVHDREVVAALDGVFESHRHVVAEVVEPELVVGPVGDVGRVRGSAFLWAHRGLDQPDLETEEPIDPAHPLRVALREVVVDRHEMDTLALERVQVAGEGRDEGLALSRPHLGDGAAVQRRSAHQLDVEVALADGAARGFARRGERLREQVVERLAVLDALPELDGLVGELLIREVLDLGLPRIDQLGELLELFASAALADVAEPVDDGQGGSFSCRGTSILPAPRVRPGCEPALAAARPR